MGRDAGKLVPLYLLQAVALCRPNFFLPATTATLAASSTTLSAPQGPPLSVLARQQGHGKSLALRDPLTQTESTSEYPGQVTSTPQASASSSVKWAGHTPAPWLVGRIN